MTTYLRSNQASLYLGVLLCTGQTTDAAGNVFTIDAQAAEATWGYPIPIDVAVQRWMTDGAVASTQGHENREIAFRVKVAAANSVALAAGEDALVTAVNGATQLAWVSPEGAAAAPTTVFDIWTAHLAHQYEPDEELRLTRTYLVSCTAKPWARSEDPITSTALPLGGTPTTVTVDACTATTNWTGSPNSPTVFGGTAIRESAVEPVLSSQRATRSLTRTASVTGMGTTPYLAIDARFSGMYLASMSVTVDGKTCARVATSGTVGYWKVPAGVTSFTKLVVTAVSVVYSGGPLTIVLDVYDVTRTNTIVGVSTHKMLAQRLDVSGSVKTSGSIQVASPSATVLGTVLAYTCPDTGSGYTPPLRPYRSSGPTVTADATCVSGNREPIATAAANNNTIYSIPSGFIREGTYVVVARLIFVGGAYPASFPLKFSTLSLGNVELDTITTTVTAAAAGVVWAVIGAISVPGTARPDESTLPVGVLVGAANNTGGGGPTVNLDEAFLMDVTRGAFSLVGGAPTTFTNLWIDSPDASTKNRPEIYYGANADRSDASAVPYAQILSLGDHDLDPSGAVVFTVTDGVDDAAVTASYYPRWHTHAAA